MLQFERIKFVSTKAAKERIDLIRVDRYVRLVRYASTLLTHMLERHSRRDEQRHRIVLMARLCHRLRYQRAPRLPPPPPHIVEGDSQRQTCSWRCVHLVESELGGHAYTHRHARTRVRVRVFTNEGVER